MSRREVALAWLGERPWPSPGSCVRMRGVRSDRDPRGAWDSGRTSLRRWPWGLAEGRPLRVQTQLPPQQQSSDYKGLQRGGGDVSSLAGQRTVVLRWEGGLAISFMWHDGGIALFSPSPASVEEEGD